MQVSVEQLSKFERRLKVAMPLSTLENRVGARVRELSRTLRLNGFRAGKVPESVVRNRFGKQIRGEELGELISQTLGEAISNEKLRPAVRPVVEELNEVGELSFSARFEVLPEFEAIDISDLEVERVGCEIDDSDVDDMIETLRKQRRSWQRVDRAAGTGDLALFEYAVEGEGFRHPEEGSERVGTVIGSAMFTEAVEAALDGMALDEEKSVEVSFPEDFRVQALAGRSGKINLRLMRLQEEKIPEVDEDFIASFGLVDSSLETFRREVRNNLQREMQQTLLRRLKNEVAEKLVARFADAELPSLLVREEAGNLWRAAQPESEPGEPQVEPQEGEVGFYLEPARKRVLAGLLLSAIAEQQGIQLDQRRLRDTIAMIASTYEQPEQVVQLYQSNEQLMNRVASQVIEDQVVDWVAEHAKHVDQSLSFRELMGRSPV